jgi:ribonuclease J
LAKIKDKSFDGFRSGIEQQRVGSTVFQHPSDFVYFVRSPKEKLVDALRKHGVINIIYSQWEGYLKEEHKTHYTDYINALKSDSGISFLTMHTSGHATVPDLITFAKAINPKKIIPIHTNKPREFKNAFEKEGFSNITLWEDGKEYQV